MRIALIWAAPPTRDTGALPDDDSLANAVDAFHESFVASLDSGATETVVVQTTASE